MLAVGREGFGDLRRQLARRRQHQRARRARAARCGCAASQALQDRQREAGGLAGAGLRRRQQVAPGEHDGDGLRLDRRGHGIAGVVDRAQQFGNQIKSFKGHSNTPEYARSAVWGAVGTGKNKLKKSCASQTALTPPGEVGLQEGQIGPERDCSRTSARGTDAHVFDKLGAHSTESRQCERAGFHKIRTRRRL